MDKKIILSMTTIPCRQGRLSENIPSILMQTYVFDVLLINVDDNLTDEEYQWYNDFAKQDERIIINKSEAKWRSCNKLLPALKLYSDDIIITIDDDIYYPKDSIKELVEQYEKTPDCIIAHEVQPILINDNKISYLNGLDVKLKQVEWGKYMSNCALYPPHSFDGTDLFNYDKMMYYTNGVHDELWFWLNSTLNKVKVIGLNFIRTFSTDIKTPWQEGEVRLADYNNDNSILESYMVKINESYGKQLLEIILNDKPEFILNKDNIALFCHEYKVINSLYNYGFKINTDDLTSGWIYTLYSLIKNNNNFVY